MNTLSEKELIIIDKLSDNGDKITQRQLAQRAGLSLGFTNIILKRLVDKGYIKIRQLNHKKMYYILTPQGISEKFKKSCRYIFKTIREINNIKDCILELLTDAYKSGSHKICVIGDNDLTEIFKLFSNDIAGLEFEWQKNYPINEDIGEIDYIIDCRDDGNLIGDLSVNKKIVNFINYYTGYLQNNLAT